MDPEAALAETLRLIVPRLDASGCRWTVIASAAVAIHTGNAEGVGDVDVLLDEPGAEAVFAALGLPLAAGAGTDRFRSRLFGTWHGAPMAVELFAGFELCRDGVWQDVRVEDCKEVRFGTIRAVVPAVDELRDMLRSFGRDKDLARAAMLSPSGQSPSRSGSA
jgi:hypothetical protein